MNAENNFELNVIYSIIPGIYKVLIDTKYALKYLKFNDCLKIVFF
jgi:hypothetical protein